MSSCCSIPSGPALPCPSCHHTGPIVGQAPVRAHQPDAADGAWQHCPTPDCPVIYYLDQASVEAGTAITQVGHKATHRPTPVCFCFAHTSDNILADVAANHGRSTIKATSGPMPCPNSMNQPWSVFRPETLIPARLILPRRFAPLRVKPGPGST